MNPAILLVDDEQSICSALNRTFKRSKYTVFQANNGQQALSILKKNHIDAIVSDQRMPGMSGTQLLTIVKKRYPKIGRIILSGYSNEQELSDSINKAGVDEFLTKPWNDEQLIKSVDNSIAKPLRINHTRTNTDCHNNVADLPANLEKATKTITDAFTPLHTDLELAIKNDELLLEEHQCISIGTDNATLRYLKFSWPDYLGINQRGLINTAYQADYIRNLFTWYLLKSIAHMEDHSERDEDIVIDLFYPAFLNSPSLRSLLKKLISQKPNIILRASFELLQNYQLESLLSDIYRNNKCLMLNLGKLIVDVNQLKNTPIKYIEVEAGHNIVSNHLLAQMHKDMIAIARKELIKTVLSRPNRKIQQEYAKKIEVDFC